jgi:DNA-binding HxlR family transcriptional regulator
MEIGYGQFCPVAKAAEVFATRWTPLVLRELMSDSHSFNDIHRGVPLMSRAVLVARLRELEHHGVIERRRRASGSGHDYWLTATGEALRPIVDVLGKWGLAHARAWLKPTDFDPTIVMWGLRKRADRDALPDRRVVVRFEFAGVPRSHTKFRILWLVLNRSDVDICTKDPGFPVDLTFSGKVQDFVALYLGYVEWHDVVRTTLRIEGDRQLAKQLPIWLRLDKVYGRDFPVVRLTA